MILDSFKNKLTFLFVIVAAMFWSQYTPEGPRPNKSFQAYKNIFNGSCDAKDCAARLQRDMKILGADNVMWIDAESNIQGKTTLEHLAKSIFDFHCGNVPGCGGEWWIQIRGTKNLDPKKPLPLHWDKDEIYNRKYGEYKGPYMTSVTYLNNGSLPTIALDVTLNDVYDLVPRNNGKNSLSRIFLGVPQYGTHISFDGALLHGPFMSPEVFISNSTPDVRYVLVMSFWVDGYKPQEARKNIPNEKAAIMSKGRIMTLLRTPNKHLVPVSGELADNLRLKGSFSEYEFQFEHTNPLAQLEQTYKVKLCLPNKPYLNRTKFASIILHYGEVCKADIILEKSRGVHGMNKALEGSIIVHSITGRVLRDMRYFYFKLYHNFSTLYKYVLLVSDIEQVKDKLIHFIRNRLES